MLNRQIGKFFLAMTKLENTKVSLYTVKNGIVLQMACTMCSLGCCQICSHFNLRNLAMTLRIRFVVL